MKAQLKSWAFLRLSCLYEPHGLDRFVSEFTGRL